MHHLKISFALLLCAALLSFKKVSNLSVTSPAFKNSGMIPAKYSCEGTEVSPALKIGNLPAATLSLAIILHDPDAPVKGGFTHWVVWNIEPGSDIPEDFKGAEQGLNGMRRAGYKGMCPPSGKHRYYFTVYALDTKLKLGITTDKAALEKAMQGHILAVGELVGLYSKTKK